VRTRIIGLAVWAAVLAIALFGVPLAAGVLQYALAQERAELERTANEVAIAVAADVEPGEELEDVPEAGAVEVTVYDKHGVRVGGTGPDGDPPEVAEALDGGVGVAGRDGDLIVAVRVTHDAEVIGVARAAVPRSGVVGPVVLIWAAMAGLAGLAVGAVWLLARRQARRLARPLEELAVSAHRLGDGDFSVRNRTEDIPEIDAVGTALNTTAVRLDDMLARERAFSADASHQLRTPLAGLRLRLEAALEKPDHDLRPAIIASLTDADRLENTIEELLNLARETSTSGRPVDMRGLLEEIERDWRARLEMRGRRIQLTLDPRTPRPHASAAAVRQVLTVLIDNAATHGAGTVEVAVREAANAVAIDVSDEGGGVGKPEPELFARRADVANGHGIGLALARRLAEAEGGRLQLTRPAPPVFTLLLAAEGEGRGPAEEREEGYRDVRTSGSGAASSSR
jgi:signal transduction histidine kinase